MWLNAKTSEKHKQTIPAEYAHLLGNAMGMKSKETKLRNPINDCMSHCPNGFAYCQFEALGIPCLSKMNLIFQTKLADSC
jgi:hypothetical protein